MIAVSGANGFTGRFVCAELQRRQQVFVAVLRPGSDITWMKTREIPVRFADLNDVKQLAMALSGCSVLLNVASIGFGAAPSIVQACGIADIRRVVFVSTTAIFTQLNAGSKAVRQAAESVITSSGLDFTILRPTMIYGTPGDRNMIRLVRWLDRLSVLPIFGDGCSLQQPVHVSDVAWALVQASMTPCTIDRSLNLSGAAALTFNEVVKLTAKALGKQVHLLHLPSQPIVVLLEMIERLGIKAPIKSEQILRLNEHKAFSHKEAAHLLGYSPIGFAEGICKEVKLFRSGSRR
tara:strand:- start:1885 stop:2760 length:876 start_codon:yes stop_codon:yes gene_type:complete